MKNLHLSHCVFGYLLVLSGIHSLPAQTQQHNSVSGAVFDAETNLPLPNAQVFIDKSLIGCITDSSGHFQLLKVPAGNFEVVASLIGYEVQKKEITISGDFKGELVFELRPTVLQGPEVLVTAQGDKQWRHDLEKFTLLLLSNTKNGREIRIQNAHFLAFSENEAGQFLAVARAPLIIENLALGYRLDFLLTDFVATSQNLRYAGYTRFEELVPQSPEQNRSWQKNRQRAYQGSLRHFLATICDTTSRLDRRLKEQGFEVFSFKHAWERETKRVAEPVNWKTFFGPSKNSNEVYLSFPDYLGVKYLYESEERNFLRHHQIERDPQAQESWIKLEQSLVKVDRTGRYLGDTAIIKCGYWAWERLADMLPFEYKLENSSP
ncbi:MAG: carboxypeptidase-like regulatory domain-containing protein [bacterium]